MAAHLEPFSKRRFTRRTSCRRKHQPHPQQFTTASVTGFHGTAIISLARTLAILGPSAYGNSYPRFAIAAVHHQSHRWNWLWQFHAVHHSVTRMYGFNGLMKHPVHQCIETAIGIAPLWVMGIPADVAQALTFCVALQLLLQHSNVDYRTGPIKYLLANAEVHRFHHLRPPASGDINFGLFTTIYDHVAGTFFYDAKTAPRDSEAIGLSDRQFPQRYDHQLTHPFQQIFEQTKRSK